MQSDDVQEVRNRLDIVELISTDVQLKKTGRTYRGLCPFHQEKTPSFYVDPVKQLFYCFGCGEGGDVFTYVSKREQLDFQQTLQYLADKVGYQLSHKDSGSKSKKRLYEANALAAKFYHAVLKRPEGKNARLYLQKRGLELIADEFLLGFSPNRESCLKFLQKKGFSPKELVEAGLAGSSAKGLYDRFHHRLIFPIQDFQGRFVAFGARSLDNSLPKYVNSPETALFKKSQLLYGLPQAKTAILTEQTAVLVEGYTDLLALHQAGIKNVVATLGTAFTLDHLQLLSRYAEKIVLVFDGDEAGLRAAERCRQFLGQLETTAIYVLVLPEQLDPADYLAKYKVDSFKLLLKEAQPLFDFLLQRLTQRFGFSSSEAKINLARQVVNLLSNVTSPVSQENYLKKAAELLGVSYEALLLELKTTKQAEFKLKPQKELKIAVDPLTSAREAVEKEIIKLLVANPEKKEFFNNIPDEYWLNDVYFKLFKLLKETNQVEAVISSLNAEEKTVYAQLTLDLNKQPVNIDVDRRITELKKKLKEKYLEAQIKQLKAKLENINKADKNYDDVFKKLVLLEFERHKIKTEAK